MKKIFIALAIISSILYGHGGHDHKSKSAIQQIAKKKIEQLIRSSKIDKSWSNPYISNTKKKQFGNKMEWMISLENSYIKDKTKQIIFVFVSEDGEVKGVNYTGK